MGSLACSITLQDSNAGGFRGHETPLPEQLNTAQHEQAALGWQVTAPSQVALPLLM